MYYLAIFRHIENSFLQYHQSWITNFHIINNFRKKVSHIIHVYTKIYFYLESVHEIVNNNHNKIIKFFLCPNLANTFKKFKQFSLKRSAYVLDFECGRFSILRVTVSSSGFF